MKYIDIEKNLIPYRFDISLADEMFTLEVHFNEERDFFTVDLERDGEILVVGEKIVYSVPLFFDVMDNRFPKVSIVPYDESENSIAVTWETLSESVFLYVVAEDDDDDT
ncbi:phage baseplate plug family protein [Paenibacillus macquariensis]|uniref:Cyanophage baseplate Pam3 plug gp18 domain-containing protein n=1 Tax=Paenibacillus macquariensis TaxID=948756 RepID=A0ABY1JS76_9BACL|nr:hypothetical protein [Paenibacillus macquariensis]MEC0092890.1 hypothetical protein [Paenibacillus macquariensis]OAB36262.1 hypothetical protein PMSM_07385 [Paenibacillus macquariensis subsp. macquariensis]SIQ68209.1 hypothetical protein SAMN05421578_103344 [Paenibacillus macquariensis]